MNVAVMLTAHRRPAYLHRILSAWQQVEGIGKVAEFRIALDESDREQQMLEVIGRFPFATVQVNRPRRGVSCNPVDSGTEVLNDHPDVGFLLLAEEDILPSRDVLAWLTWAAETFEGRPDILMACAHQRLDGTDPHLAHLSTDFAPWIWGTWRDRWFNVLCPTWDRAYYTGDCEQPNCGFDWNIADRIIPRLGMCTVLPDQSRSQNLGQYEGVHADPSAWAGTLRSNFREDQEPVDYRLA